MSTIFDNFFLFLTLLGNYALVWFGLAVFVASQQMKKAQSVIVSTTYVISFSFFATTVLKLIFRVPRPSYFILDTKYCPLDYSFPSGHAATSFAAAIVLAQFDPKRKWLYFALASLISYSRIYLNCHHVVDVVVGAVLGIVTAYFVLKITAKQPKRVAKAKRSL